MIVHRDRRAISQRSCFLSPLPWLFMIPFLTSGVHQELNPVNFRVVPMVVLQAVQQEAERGVPARRELAESPRSEEFSDWSPWGWTIGQFLSRDPQRDSFRECGSGREDLAAQLLHHSEGFQARWLPLDASFQPLGIDPLLHAPPWWSPNRIEGETTALNLWACEVTREGDRDPQPQLRAGVGLTLDLLSGDTWDCRLTGNFDQRGEAGVLLQFCWH